MQDMRHDLSAISALLYPAQHVLSRMVYLIPKVLYLFPKG
jgi:hypothetical protein